MVKEEYVSFETAKLAKEKGFNEHCNHYYDSDRKLNYHDQYISNSSLNKLYDLQCYLAPTQSLLVRWFRETKELHIEVEFWCYMGENYCEYTYDISKPYEGVDKDVLWFNTYEEAMEAGLQEALKLIF